jgi:hypothetical protein
MISPLLVVLPSGYYRSGMGGDRRDNKKKPGRLVSCDISATRLSQGDPWAFRPTLADGLVLSSICFWNMDVNFYPTYQVCQQLVKGKMKQCTNCNNVANKPKIPKQTDNLLLLALSCC